MQNVRAWYDNTQPRFKLPGMVFGGIWFLMYGAMTVAIFKMWYANDAQWWTETQWLIFSNVVLNKMWSPIFFSQAQLAYGQTPADYKINRGIVALSLLVMGGILGTAISALVFMISDEEVVASILWGIYVAWLAIATLLNMFYLCPRGHGMLMPDPFANTYR